MWLDRIACAALVAAMPPKKGNLGSGKVYVRDGSFSTELGIRAMSGLPPPLATELRT